MQFLPRLVICGLLVCAAGRLHAGEPAGKYYSNKRWGFKVRIPSHWITAALSADEEWIACKHFAKKELQAKKTIWWETSRPEMWVIGFPHARQQERGARKFEDEQKRKSVITFKNPYKDYKDFLKRERWYAGGGYFFTEEEKGEHAGMKVTKYEIRVDKMVAAPFRIKTWVYHFPDVDYAVQFKVYEAYFRGYKKTFLTCLRSFKRIERTKALPGGATTGDKKVFEDIDEDDLTPEERAKLRRDKVLQKYQREIDNLPKGWHHRKTDHFLVMSNASKKYTKDVLRHSKAIRGYLDETFGTLGVEYVPPAIIRIFKTYPELKAYRSGTRRFWSSRVTQVLMTEGDDLDDVNWDLTSQFFHNKNKDLDWNMPRWIDTGLNQHMSFARTKGKKVTFVFDSWDKDDLRTLLKNDEAIPLRELISGLHEEKDKGLDLKGGIDIDKLMKSSRQGTQAGSVVTYLLTKGNKGKLKGALANYMKALIAAIEEAEAEYEKTTDAIREEVEREAQEKAAEKPPSSDEEEEDEEESEEESEADKERAKKYREAMKLKKKTIREKAFLAAFSHLTDKDWKRIDRSWRRFVD